MSANYLDLMEQCNHPVVVLVLPKVISGGMNFTDGLVRPNHDLPTRGSDCRNSGTSSKNYCFIATTGKACREVCQPRMDRNKTLDDFLLSVASGMPHRLLLSWRWSPPDSCMFGQ